MFAAHIRSTIGDTRSVARLDALAGRIWEAWGQGAVNDDEASALSAELEAQRRVIRPLDTVAVRAPIVARLATSCFPPRRVASSPDRAASLARRRMLAASGVMPPALAARFTTGELAALRIVADECAAQGRCERTIGEIAGRAGVSLSTARNGLRAAAAMGLALIVERRRHRAPNLPNVVRIVSPEWRAWIARRPRSQGGGFKKAESTDRSFAFHPKRPSPTPANGLPKGQAASASLFGHGEAPRRTRLPRSESAPTSPHL